MLKSRLKNFFTENKGGIITAALIIALDRASKILALNLLAAKGSVEVLPFFRLTYVENTGAAFGSFRDGNLFLIIACAVILFFMFKWKADVYRYGKAAQTGFVFIVAGALGNLYDRLTLGFVVDYFDFIVWPVFNIADSFICIGAGLIAFAALKDAVKNNKGKNTEDK